VGIFLGLIIKNMVIEKLTQVKGMTLTLGTFKDVLVPSIETVQFMVFLYRTADN